MNAREMIVERVRRFGGSTTDAVLDPLCNIFTVPGIDGMICYRKIGKCAIAFGDPVCRAQDREALVQAFRGSCLENNLNIVYLIVSKDFAKWEREKFGGAYLEYGEELYLDPYEDPREKTGSHACLVRRKVKQAVREGVTVHEYFGSHPDLEAEIDKVGKAWLGNRRGPQIHISHIHLFQDRLGKRWFYAKRGQETVGVVVLNELQAKKGWHMNHLMIKPKSPGGTPELLVTSILETLKSEGCHYVSFGGVPGRELGEIIGFGKLPSWIARKVFAISSYIFGLRGTKIFWNKFLPKSTPSYLLFEKPKIGFSEILGLMRALNVRL